MSKHLSKLGLIIVLGSGFVWALGTAQYPAQNPPAVPQTQQPSSADQSRSAASTADVQEYIQSAFQKEQSLSSANISVRVTDKGVELSGTAPTKEAKEAAERIAREHAGGLEVKNQIEVSPSSPKH